MNDYYNDITAIVLTKNEEVNILECISSIRLVSPDIRIIVIDSYSTDKTVELAKTVGVEVYANVFVNHGFQWRYALSVSNVATTWTMRVDADERFTQASARELRRLCASVDASVTGIVFLFEVSFMGRVLRYGGASPFSKISCYRSGHADIDTRNLQDQFALKDGHYVVLMERLKHLDYKGLDFWITKHNWYASGAALDFFQQRLVQSSSGRKDIQSRIRHFVKTYIYYRIPMGIRAWLNFCYRYYLRLGFLDGKEGYFYAFFQAYWYRVLVDAKICELRRLGVGGKIMGDLKQ